MNILQSEIWKSFGIVFDPSKDELIITDTWGRYHVLGRVKQKSHQFSLTFQGFSCTGVEAVVMQRLNSCLYDYFFTP